MHVWCLTSAGEAAAVRVQSRVQCRAAEHAAVATGEAAERVQTASVGGRLLQLQLVVDDERRRQLAGGDAARAEQGRDGAPLVPIRRRRLVRRRRHDHCDT